SFRRAYLFFFLPLATFLGFAEENFFFAFAAGLLLALGLLLLTCFLGAGFALAFFTGFAFTTGLGAGFVATFFGAGLATSFTGFSAFLVASATTFGSLGFGVFLAGGNLGLDGALGSKGTCCQGHW